MGDLGDSENGATAKNADGTNGMRARNIHGSGPSEQTPLLAVDDTDRRNSWIDEEFEGRPWWLRPSVGVACPTESSICLANPDVTGILASWPILSLHAGIWRHIGAQAELVCNPYRCLVAIPSGSVLIECG